MTMDHNRLRRIAADAPMPGEVSGLEVQDMARELLETRRLVKQRSRADTASQAAEAWQPIETAPKDCTLILLLIAPEDREHALEDSYDPTQTIGHNNFEHDGEDVWQFAGWDWCQDHYCAGKGRPVMWAPLPAIRAAAMATASKEGDAL